MHHLTRRVQSGAALLATLIALMFLSFIGLAGHSDLYIVAIPAAVAFVALIGINNPASMADDRRKR